MKLNPYDIDLGKDDIAVLNTPDTFSRRLSTEDAQLSMDVPIVIKYDYVDLGKTAYHFKQEFLLEDTQNYFSIMKDISSNTINNLVRKGRQYHFYRSDYRGNLKRAVALMFNNVDEDIILYHVGLYESEGGEASRETGKRSPRIYFILGNNGHIYILFFDPYHELNPLTKL